MHRVKVVKIYFINNYINFTYVLHHIGPESTIKLQRFFYRVHVKIVIYDKDIVIIETMELDVFKTFGFIATFIVQ